VRNRPGTVTRHTHRIVDDLDEEWRALVEPAFLPVAWTATHPALAACRDFDDLLARASQADDEVLRPLLAEVLGGDALAARTVLQAMLGRLVRMAGRDRQATIDDYVGALWCVLVRYPLARRPGRIAANLALDTLKTVHGDRCGRGTAALTLWPAGDALEALLEQAWQRATLDHAAALDALDASAVIEAGRRLRLINQDTSGLLRHVYVDGLSGRDAAVRAGTSAGSLRVRCSRAVRRLAAHAGELIEAA